MKSDFTPSHRFPPSIFNDVIGPVMRGPSSSHCAAAVRIGLMVRDLMDGSIEDVLVQFDPNGSLATTHESQGSDMGLAGGLLGMDATDPRIVDAVRAIEEAGIGFATEVTPLGAVHPNTYKITVAGGRETHVVTALSTGGGIVEVVGIDGVAVSMAGDCHETLFFYEEGGDRLAACLKETFPAEAVGLFCKDAVRFVAVKSRARLSQETISALCSRFKIRAVKRIGPVLPILSRRKIGVPFITTGEMFAFNRSENLDLWELAVRYETDRGEISRDEVLEKMAGIVDVMQGAVDAGLAGTDYADRILGVQSARFKDRMNENRLIDGGALNRIILSVTALMESKSSMGLIVAAPTAGACAGLPGACIGAAGHLGLSKDSVIRAMLAGGIIGVFISAHATFAAEVGGCQSECGAGSAMAAAALVDLAGGSARQAVDAASLALQNVLGMVCDPVAKRVEVPCLGKNVLAAANALACANMALADYDPVIPFDEVVETMDAVGRMLPSALRCTGLGGLSATKTSKNIEKRLSQGR